MKKILPKILGTALVFLLAFTMLGVFMPASEVEAGKSRWSTVNDPNAGGSRSNFVVADCEVIDIEVCDDGTMFAAILAEAANEIGGPDHAVGGMSARNVIAAIRERAGINQPDGHLASIGSKEEMRNLIRNERRLELCFEGHRFWDLRRWGLSLNESVSGYFHNGSSYVEIPVVETRDYPGYAKYLPIPNSEIIKFPALEQNQGW